MIVVQVRRGPYLVQDTLIQINRAKETDTLRKPLKVHCKVTCHTLHVDCARPTTFS